MKALNIDKFSNKLYLHNERNPIISNRIPKDLHIATIVSRNMTLGRLLMSWCVLVALSNKQKGQHHKLTNALLFFKVEKSKVVKPSYGDQIFSFMANECRKPNLLTF